MASDSLKTLRQKLTTDAIRDAQVSAGGGTKSDLLKCSRCKKRNCSYTQVTLGGVTLGGRGRTDYQGLVRREMSGGPDEWRGLMSGGPDEWRGLGKVLFIRVT